MEISTLNSSSRTAVKAANRLLITFRCAQGLSAAPDVMLSAAKHLGVPRARCFAVLSMTNPLVVILSATKDLWRTSGESPEEENEIIS